MSAIPSWWDHLYHRGLLIGPGQLEENYLEPLPRLPSYIVERLRRAVTRVDEGEAVLGTLLDTVLEDVLGLEAQFWDKNPGTAWTHAAITKDRIRPRRVLTHPDGTFLAVFDTRSVLGSLPAGQKTPRIGVGRGRQMVSRVVEWLRKSGRSKVAILTTGTQWALIHAGENYDAWSEWETSQWFTAGEPGPQVDALRALLGTRSVLKESGATRSRLEAAILDSRRGEADLSAILGERVRQAVEKLIQCSTPALDALVQGDQRDHYNEIYLAATRIVMRCVVVLFAEARDLLPLSEPNYHDSYSIQGLRENLEHLSDDALRESNSAWPRLVALFRLLHEGSDHGQFPVVRYGGRLFESGDTNSGDPVNRAIAAFEENDAPTDFDVKELLGLLAKTYAKLRQRRGSLPFAVPVNFSAMDTEYIGILYEGLLDFNLRRVSEDPIVILRIGDYPVLPWSRLSRMEDAELEAMLGKLKKKSNLQVSEDEGDGDKDPEPDDSDEDDQDAALDITEVDTTPISAADALHAEVFEFAVKAVKLAKLIPALRGRRTPERLKEHEDKARTLAKLVFHIKRPGEWYLVRFGNTRKGSGTFYTRPQLAAPTVRRTLFPLCYLPNGSPREPDHLLGVKVCDPAMGSGSFLISALRYVTDALLASLYHYDRIEKRPGEWICRIADGLPAEHISDETAPVPAAQPDAEERLEAKLRRYVVERCLYGVDVDDMAVELGRMALWIETMHRELPFGFLDHKIKPGNSLVGCWFDRFEDYPATAWLREGGDKDHKAVDKSRPNWTKEIANRLRDQVKPNLQRYIGLNRQENFGFVADGRTPAQVHDRAMALLDQMHQLAAHEVEERRRLYGEMRADPAFQRLCLAFDTWCALWFWPGDRLQTAPLPSGFVAPDAAALEEVKRIRASGRTYRFFHWELEFPDVFGGGRRGFDAVVGNPPWEVQKPNSREFFSNIDPLYRGYGKTDAEAKQKELFRGEASVEHEWLAERARVKALSNWVKNAGRPFGDYTRSKPDGTEEWIFSPGRRFKDSADLHRRWAKLRRDRVGYADVAHPFLHQGSADLNTYKMFLEVGYRLLRDDGRLGFLVPSGAYSDQGSTDLRTLFLDQSQWEWLFGFENREKIFDIDSRFKFAALIVRKGGETCAIRTSFMHRALADWEDAEEYSAPYPIDQVVRFSPFSKAIVEIRSDRDLSVFEKAYSNGALLGSGASLSWNITCKREFHMTDDVRSGAFQRLSTLEGTGHVKDVFGNWLRGGWRSARPHEGPDVVPSADSLRSIALSDIEDIALPVYQGVMIAPLLPSAATYVSATATRGEWAVPSQLNEATSSQFLMAANDYHGSKKRISGLRLLYRVQARTTDARTTIAALVEGCPFGHSLNAITVPQYDLAAQIAFGGLFVSFAHDWLIRQRMGGANLSIFYLHESVCPNPTDKRIPKISSLVARLNLIQPRNSGTWLLLRAQLGHEVEASQAGLALTPHERLRLRCVLDAAGADIYGLSDGDLRRILEDCDHPVSNIKDDDFSRTLDPKGFWRVDKEEPPELRHTVLSLVAFRDLQTMGFDRFINEWGLPDKLRLADYDLGRDDRAQEAQPVANVLGPRFLERQTSRSVEESWEECTLRAELLEKIIPIVPSDFGPEENETAEGDGQIRLAYED